MKTNNREFWQTAEAAMAAFDVYVQLARKTTPIIQQKLVFEWMYKESDGALQLREGEIVQAFCRMRYGEDPKLVYAKVVGYAIDETSRSDIFNVKKVRLRAADGSEFRLVVDYPIHSAFDTEIPDNHIRRSDIPKDFMDLVAPRCPVEAMKDKCPFRDEYKEPVPPCMKEKP